MSKKEIDAFKGVFREDPWATPLLSLSVIALCVLLLYTVICFCSWIQPSPRKSVTLLPWLQLPLLLGLMSMVSTAIVAAVPFSDPSCRMLFIGPGVSYVLLIAGLMSRIIQQSIRTHEVLQWLLMFFVVLNQVVISAAYLAHTSKTSSCRSTVSDQLFMMLYPGLLVSVVLLLVYRTTRRTKSEWKSREAVYIGLAATFTGAFAAFWLSAAAVLGDELLSACLGYGCLATAVVVSFISLIPRQEQSELYSDGLYEKNRVYVHERSKEMPIKRSENLPTTRAEPVTNDPEIIIVPVTPDGQVLSEMAIKTSAGNLQRLPSRRSRDPGGCLRESRRHRHHHHNHHRNHSLTRRESLAFRPQKWHSRLRSEWTLGKRLRTLRKRKEPSNVREFGMTIKENPNPRTPYNHRGWLY